MINEEEEEVNNVVKNFFERFDELGELGPKLNGIELKRETVKKPETEEKKSIMSEDNYSERWNRIKVYEDFLN